MAEILAKAEAIAARGPAGMSTAVPRRVRERRAAAEAAARIAAGGAQPHPRRPR